MEMLAVLLALRLIVEIKPGNAFISVLKSPRSFSSCRHDIVFKVLQVVYGMVQGMSVLFM